MTVLISDAKSLFAASGRQLTRDTLVKELLYADDMLLVEVDESSTEHYMQCVANAGRACGLSFNWSKLEILTANHECHIPTPNGKPIPQK